MLAIQNFLYKHPNDWEEILTAEPYNLTIKKKKGLVLFKYSQLNSDLSLQICQEARGLIFEEETWKVIRIAFGKFFNLGEPNAAEIDWASATASEKLDGSLMSVYYYNDEWHVATSGNIDAEDAPLENTTYKTFRELFDAAAQNCGLDYSILNKNYTYTFEMVSPFQRIVLSYPETTLYHILTRDNLTLEEIETSIGIQKPSLYILSDKEDYVHFVQSLGENHEGIVVKDKFNKRVKIKTEHYFMLHYLTNKVVLTLRRTIGLIRKNDYEEILAYFPHYRPWVEEVKEKLGAAAQKNVEINTEVAKMKETCANRKEFVEALKSKSKNDFRLYMLAYDNNLDNWFAYDPEASEAVETKKIADIIKYYELDK